MYSSIQFHVYMYLTAQCVHMMYSDNTFILCYDLIQSNTFAEHVAIFLLHLVLFCPLFITIHALDSACLQLHNYFDNRVFTTLIGDAIQDHLFETQTVTTSFSNTSSKKQDTISTFSSVSSLQQTPRQILHENIKQSNSDDHNVTDPQGTTTSLSILRRNVGRGSRNRRSAVYSETTVEESQGNMKKFISTGDLQVHLLTVNDDGIKDWRKTQQDIDGVDTVTGTVDTKQPNNEEKINKKEEKPRDETVVASEENGIHEKICESNSNKPPEEFDCVARSTGILYHVSHCNHGIKVLNTLHVCVWSLN